MTDDTSNKKSRPSTSLSTVQSSPHSDKRPGRIPGRRPPHPQDSAASSGRCCALQCNNDRRLDRKPRDPSFGPTPSALRREEPAPASQATIRRLLAVL